jgi:mRNA-degrading endonuclease RelE of RelBE toxin-antitoxin system
VRLELRWDDRVPAALRTLPDPERRRVTGMLLSLQEDPQPPVSRPLPGKPTWFRLVTGRFAILYAVDRPSSTLTIYEVTRDGDPLGSDSD